MADNMRSDNEKDNITNKEIIDKLFKQLEESNKLNCYTVKTMENIYETNRKILTEQSKRSEKQNTLVLIVSSLVLTIVLCTSVFCYFGFGYGWDRDIKVTNESKNVNESYNTNKNINENSDENNR